MQAISSNFFCPFLRSKSSSGLGYHPFHDKLFLTSPVTGERKRGSMLMVKNGIFVLEKQARRSRRDKHDTGRGTLGAKRKVIKASSSSLSCKRFGLNCEAIKSFRNF